MSVPTVSVVMPAYNAEAYVAEAVESILRQSLDDLELVAVNDGSTDTTGRVLDGYAARDPRVIVLHNEHHSGVTRSLNTGLAIARAGLIARQDADDVSLPERLSKQVRFLQERAECVCVGCRPRVPGERPPTREHWPADDLRIRWRLLFRGAVPHPGLTVRAGALRQAGGYDESFRYAQDYDLACRLSRLGALANLPEELVLL